MPVKIQKRLQALSLLETTREDFKKEIHEKFGKELIDLIEKGINPIKGQGGKQVLYSESYKDQIKNGSIEGKNKISPVNLRQKGDLHKSLKIDISGQNPYVEFTDEKADWHNNVGVGKNKVKRRLLPTNDGEEFTSRLFQKIMDALKSAIKKNTK